MPTACCPSGSSAAPASGGFTGIYKMKNGEALVQETNGRIKFSINAAYGQNVGEVAGEVPLTGDTAKYVDRDGDCVLSFKFAAGKLDLAQDGTCGMGLNVSGSGTYKRMSTTPPKLANEAASGLPLRARSGGTSLGRAESLSRQFRKIARQCGEDRPHIVVASRMACAA
jgi:hypothetical protein